MSRPQRAVNRSLRSISVILGLLVGSVSIQAQDDTRVTATWKVVKYDISATLPQAENDRALTAKAKLDLKNVSARPASTLSMRISPAAEVTAVSINGASATFTKAEEKIGTGSLQRIAIRVPPVAPDGSLVVIVDYKLTVKDNSGLNTISANGSQFLPLSFWYPTPNSWYFARGADYAPFRVQINAPGQTVVASGAEAGGSFDQKFTGQPFFVAGSWDVVNANGVAVYLPKGSGADEQKLAAELGGLAAEAKAYFTNLMGPAPDSPLRLVAVRRAGGFSGGGTILVDDSLFRRGRLDSQNVVTVADAIAKTWLGTSMDVNGDGAGVIREGLTRYLAAQFLESKFGKDIADLERQRQRVAYAAVSRRDAPLTVVTPLDDYYYPEVANKGAMVWRILVRKVGSDEFFKGLRTAGADGSISLSEIRSQFPAEKELLDHLFDQVTETNLLAGLPQAAGAETRVALRNTGPVDVTVNVAAMLANGQRMSAPTTVRSKSFGEISFRAPTKVVRVEIDPEKLYPQTDYSDDIAPRETTDSDLLLAVKRHFDKQEFANAERLARSVLAEAPRFDDVRVLLGRSLLAQNKNAEAEKEFRAVLAEKLPSPRSIAWANVGLADVSIRGGQAAQAARYATEAIKADAEYGASLAARAIRNRANVASSVDESVKAFFAGFDRSAAANKKAELEALSVPGEVSKFVTGMAGQVVEWKTDVLHVDRIDASNAWVETALTVRLLNREVETGTAVYRLARAGGSWKLSGVEIFEVR